MTRRTAFWRQVLATAAALALLILPFAHQSGLTHEAAPGLSAHPHHHAQTVAAAPALPGDDLGHTTCHACRIDAAPLPQPPYPLEPTHSGSTIVVYAAYAAPPAHSDRPTPQSARAPPIAA